MKVLVLTLVVLSAVCFADTVENALVEFFNKTKGSAWKQKGDWTNSGVSYCQWYGVVCQGTNIQLLLSNNNVAGSIEDVTKSLGPIGAKLNALDLSMNHITGMLNKANFSSFVSLLQLRLKMNGFIQGTIPQELFNIKTLNVIDLSTNRLSGTIPSMKMLTMLGYFDLTANMLTGTLPAELTSLTTLYYLDFSHNKLSGSLPAKLNSLTNLQWFDASDNMFTGSVPALSGLTSLSRMYFSKNKLTGAIPDLSTLTKLEFLGLNNNMFTTIKLESMMHLYALQAISLQHNNFSGTWNPQVISVTNKPSLTSVDISYNSFTGPFCDAGIKINDNLKYFSLDYNCFNGDLKTCSFMSATSKHSFIVLNLAFNNFTCPIPNYSKQGTNDYVTAHYNCQHGIVKNNCPSSDNWATNLIDPLL